MILLNEWRSPPGCDQAVLEALQAGAINTGGMYSKKAEALLKEYILDCSDIFLTSSCTSALELAALSMDLTEEDEIIVPSYTFPSTINAFAQYNARIKFADVNPGSGNIMLSSIRENLSDRTKAVVVTHYAGAASELIEIQDLCIKKNIILVEDNAHGFMGQYAGKALGTFGSFGALSFHHTKNIGCGEGGAFIAANSNLSHSMLRDNGTNRRDYMEKKAAFYDWQSIGTNAMITEMAAVLLFFQLKQANMIQECRHHVWQFYHQELHTWSKKNNVRLPSHDPLASHSAHIFHMVFQDKLHAENYIEYMRKQGVQCLTHFRPLHLSPAGIKLGGYSGMCPNSEAIADTLVRLPLHPYVTTEELEHIVAATQSFESWF